MPSRLVRVRVGDYVAAERWAELDSADRHRALIFATLRRMRGEVPTLSHLSSAALWGMPILGKWPDRVHVTMAAEAAGSSTLIRRHRVESLPEPAMINGIPVTGVARTVVDLARAGNLARAVIAGDWAVREGACSLRQLDAEVDRVPRGGRGRRGAQLLQLLVDPRSESVGESLSRTRMFEGGFPQPNLQVALIDAQGEFGRADFGWDGLIGEFDGERKYRATGDAGDVASEDVVLREKAREDRARRTGVGVARWCWMEALGGEGMFRILRSAGLRPSSRSNWTPFPRE
ncbi:hypothetical protein HJ588_07645 [Flexivirga sp. ID2601S]|uniref:Transcriptional regulator, AbiEi antitoxin, Type IV TA system n=1 Tax=Flexivirga aerilata TaxID=1656889 RepID=A0A849AF79_9MICO|nr:hypothetical protein [Flexivirga aerilata]NNG39145.1 hypothetical protein [Flexivirga aerilata]